jgi:hypothetical protein
MGGFSARFVPIARARGLQRKRDSSMAASSRCWLPCGPSCENVRSGSKATRVATSGTGDKQTPAQTL